MNLSSEQKVQYLANILFIARADGKIANKETIIVEDVQKWIGAKKSELNKANQMVEQPNFKLILIGNFTDKVKNLEDLILISLIDGSLDEVEKSELINVAKELQISKDQFNYILNDVKQYIGLQKESIRCSKCNKEIDANAKFCPDCGNPINPLEQDKSISVSYEIPSKGIAIEFAESTAAGFADALVEQQNAPLNKTCQKAKKTWYIAAWADNNIINTLKLVNNLGGMRNRKVHIDGEEQRWDEVFGFTWCSEERNSAYKPVEYCFGLDDKRLNIWGCKQSRMEWTEWANWFSYGSFEKSGLLKNQVIFKFDKERIKHELKTNLFKYKYCPYLKLEFIEKVIEQFPDEVTITENGLWKYKEDYDESPGSLKVTLRTTEDGYTSTDEFYSSGVVPRSVSMGVEIVKRAIKESGMNLNDLKGVLEFKDN